MRTLPIINTSLHSKEKKAIAFHLCVERARSKTLRFHYPKTTLKVT